MSGSGAPSPTGDWAPGDAGRGPVASAPDPAAGPSDEPEATATVPAAALPPTFSPFSLEGRAAPALHLVGWLGTGLGLGMLAIAILAGTTAAAPWLFLAGLVVVALGAFAAAGSQAVERGRRSDLAYRGPSPYLAFLVVVPLVLLGVAAVVAPLSALGLDPGSPIATTISLVVTTLAYLLVVRLLVVGPGALRWSEMGWSARPSVVVRELVVGALWAVPVLGVTLVIAGILARLLVPAQSPLPPAGDAAGFVANLVSAAVLAPIGEELFFRGFATTAWARALGAAPAIARGAVFFALAHVLTVAGDSFATGAARAIVAFVGLLPAGVALGWLHLRRGSIWSAVGLHAAFNAVQVIALRAVAGT